jgi:hypothetical protein
MYYVAVVVHTLFPRTLPAGRQGRKTHFFIQFFFALRRRVAAVGEYG